MSASWALRSLTNAPLINRHFASIEDVEETQAQRCVALQAQPDLIRSTTLSIGDHSVSTNDMRPSGRGMKHRARER